jgi:hypothetical protein
MSGQIINKDLVVELVEKLMDKDEQIAMLRGDKKKIIDDYSQQVGIPDKKLLQLAISVAKKKCADKEDLEALIAIIEPIVGE